MTIAQLPQELLDTIIDFLHEDQPSLQACSLVCHNWLESSRFHKFSSVMVNNEKHFDPCHIAIPYIRKITLSFSTTLFPFDLSKCTNTRTLHIKGAEHFQIPNVPELSSAFPFSNLENISLIRCRFQNARHFIDFLFHFPLLRSLHMSKVGWDTGSLPLQKSTAIFPPFSGELSIREILPGGYEKPVIDAMASLPGVRFHTVKIMSNIRRNRSIRELNTLLKTCGSSLEKLYLHNFEMHDNGPTSPPLINVSHNFNLRRLMTPGIPEHTTPSIWLSPMLSTVNAPLLEHVEISGWTSDWNLADWSDIDSLLADRARFPNLQEVEVALWTYEAAASVPQSNPDRAMLPLVKSQGILNWCQ